jgi:hypothetical protein
MAGLFVASFAIEKEEARRAVLRRSLEEDLCVLGRKHIDIPMIHEPDRRITIRSGHFHTDYRKDEFR